jgi:hypothetical protein
MNKPLGEIEDQQNCPDKRSNQHEPSPMPEGSAQILLATRQQFPNPRIPKTIPKKDAGIAGR